MAELFSSELEKIRREQMELRLRLVALDRQIETLVFQSAKADGKSAAVEEPLIAEPVESIKAKEPVAAVPLAASIPPPVPGPEWDAPRVTAVPPQPVAMPPPPPVAKASWEFQLGTVWLVRFGIVILLTGFVFLGNYAYHHIVPHLGPWLKLGMLYLLGAGLSWLGVRLERGNESLRNYGRVLLAGGGALLYYTTYGAAFVERLRVIQSPLLGGLLLLAAGGAIVWLAEKRQAQSVALLAILLSYYTSAINPVGLFSLYSSLLLTAAAVYFLLRHRWTTISFLSLAGTYGSYAFWRFYRAGHFIAFTERLPLQAWQGAAFLLCYWILFTVAVFLSRSTDFTPEKRTPFLTLNNGAFFGLVFQILHANQPQLTGRFSLLFGAVLLLLSWVAKKRQVEDLFLDGAYLMQGLAVLTFGLVTELDGYQLSLALGIQGTLMLFSINRRHGWIYEIGAAVVTAMAFVIHLRDATGAHEATQWALIGLLIADAWLVKNFRKPPASSAWNWAATSYALLAIVGLARVLPLHFSLVPAQLAATVLLIVLGTAIRLPELAVAGQIFVLQAAFSYVFERQQITGFSVAGIVLLPLLLIHWWQRQNQRDLWKLGEGIFSTAFLAVACRWLAWHWWGTHLEVALDILAVSVLLYGVFSRAILLALGGQIILLVTAATFFSDVLIHDYARLWPTLNLALVAVNIAALVWLEKRFPALQQRLVTVLQHVWSVILFAMITAWGWEYVAPAWRMLFYVGFSTFLLLLAGWKPKAHPALSAILSGYAGMFALAGIFVFYIGYLQHLPFSWMQACALLLLAVEERLLSRGQSLAFPAPLRNAVIVIVVSGFWLQFDRQIDLNHSHFPKTLAWSLLGTVALGLGLVIRERTYRLCGLVLLAMAVLRIFIIDIWGLDPIFRILSFIVLGVVLLALGFIYNKFAEKFKEWL